MRMLAETLDGRLLNTVVGHDLKHRSLTPPLSYHTRTALRKDKPVMVPTRHSSSDASLTLMLWPIANLFGRWGRQ